MSLQVKKNAVRFFTVFPCVLLFSSSLLHAAPAKTWAPGPCSEDGFCTIISVQNEVEQRTPQGQGVIIGSIGDDGFQPAPGTHVSAKKICKKVVRVPRAVHDAVTQMFNSIVARGGAQALPAALTPSEQTILLYYNTIMQQTMSFQCVN